MLALADRVHHRLWRLALTSGWGRALQTAPALRVSMLAAAHLLVALCLTLLSPMWLLLLAPLVLGVPHVASDLRHLVLRPIRALPTGLLWAFLLIFGAMTALRIAALLGAPRFTAVELGLGAVAVAAGAAWARVSPWVRVALIAGVAVLSMPALLSPGHAALLVGHAHNFVAVGLWFWWTGRRGGGAARWVVIALLAGALGLILSGALEPWMFRSGALASAAGLTLAGMVEALAPGVPGPWGVRLVLAFALMQAVHYSMWVWCIPRAPRLQPGSAPLPPSRRWSSWRRDLGWLGVVAVVLGALLLPALGVVAPVGARSGYLTLVLFHGWLELAVAAYLIAAGLGGGRWAPRGVH